jgi:NAD-dependent dihydropyrimidine dehydrogenase PreA subunit
MGLFVEIATDDSRFASVAEREACVRACPVDVFAVDGGELTTVADNEDECILCGLCVAIAPPGSVSVRRRYGSRCEVSAGG